MYIKRIKIAMSTRFDGFLILLWLTFIHQSYFDNFHSSNYKVVNQLSQFHGASEQEHPVMEFNLAPFHFIQSKNK